MNNQPCCIAACELAIDVLSKVFTHVAAVEFMTSIPHNGGENGSPDWGPVVIEWPFGQFYFVSRAQKKVDRQIPKPQAGSEQAPFLVAGGPKSGL